MTRHGSVSQLESSTAPFHQITIGLCEDYPEESRTLAGARNDLLLLKTNHIHVLRVAFGWDAMEPERGKFDWTFWDDFVRMANELGVTLIPYICYTPQWASSEKGTNFWRAPPKEPRDFSKFVSQIVRRYKGSIHTWELWNEPDNPAYWSGTVEQFSTLLKAGSKGVRDADPTAKVVSGGIAWNVDFLRQLFEEHGVSPSVDIVNVHNYNETWSAEPLEKISEIARNVKKVVTKHGRNQPIWFAEVGYSDFRKGRFVSDNYTAQFPYEHTERFQAVSVGRAIVSAAASGTVSLFAWYRIHDLPGTQEVIGDVNNRHLGVLNESSRPKASLASLSFFNSLFSKPVRCIDSVVRCTRKLQSDVELHVFERSDGALIIIGWLTAIPRGAGELSTTRSREERVDLQLPFETESKARITDETGNRIEKLAVGSRHNRASLNHLSLREGEIKVILLHTHARFKSR